MDRRITKEKLRERVEKGYSLLEECTVCPRECKVNRLKEELGFCQTGKDPIVSSYNLHFGEEPPLSGKNGSGTIFFSHCNLKCVYCQNYPISQLGNGKKITTQKLAEMMLELEKRGAHNINFVTPSHVIPQILEGVYFAQENGFSLPLVYNSSGYDKKEALELLDGIIDIYLPDIRYADNLKAKKYSSAQNYVEINQLAIKEMFRQVGNLELDEMGMAKKGLIVRHLILPEGIAGSQRSFEFLEKEISPKVWVSLMSQYFPANQVEKFPPLNRRITEEEYAQAVQGFYENNLENGWMQENLVYEKY
jgi:putative pyruvate formate lyase activating enzyme